MIYKIEAEGDTIYVEADNRQQALERLTEFCGPIPEQLLTITTVKKLPKGEELL